jgi:hypothetical protein
LSAALVLLASFETRADFDYISGWDNQLFPSYIVATATMRPDDSDPAPDSSMEDEQLGEAEEDDAVADEQDQVDAEESMEDQADEVGEADDEQLILGDPDSMGLLGVVVMADEDETSIAVEIEAPGIIEASHWSGVLERANTNYTIFPSLKFNFKALIGNTQTIPLAVTYRVWLGEDDVDEHTINMTLRSINDCPRIIIYDKDNIENLSYMFAAYVNEQHPFVDKILRESLEKGVVESFDGYQSGDVESVIRQVYSIWDALSRRDVRYSSITASAAVNQMAISQHVRFIDQSINNAQANCVDGSALMASLLRKVEIETALILVPGHCYLAFALDPEGKRWMGLETTLIGKRNADVPVDEESDKIVPAKFHRENSWLTFRMALANGNGNLVEHMKQFENKDSLDYQFISITKSRRKGILPIAFDSSERLNSRSQQSE